MKVIITGATGFIGRNIANCFLSRDVEVHATGRDETVGLALEDKGAVFKPCDILNLEILEDVFEPADCVIHCAGKAGDWGKKQEFYNVNVIGTRNVVQACRKHGINKLVFISTPSIYFNGKDRLEIEEDEPLPNQMQTSYASTKLQAEKELLDLAIEGFNSIILRPRAVFGPYDSTITPRIIKMAARKNFPLINSGKAKVDITYIENLVEAVCQSMNALEPAWNQVYNISNGEPITMREWFESILRVYDLPFKPKNVPSVAAKVLAVMMETISKLPFGPEKPNFTRFSVGYMGKSMTLSINKAKEKLGYLPLGTNEKSFDKFRQWYIQQQY